MSKNQNWIRTGNTKSFNVKCEDEEFLKRVKIYCIEKNISLSDFALAAIKEYLKKMEAEK